MDKKTAERTEALETLRAGLTPGTRIYANITHVSKSGMQRRIRLYWVDGGQLCGLSYLASRALGWPLDDRGIKVDGCGMDMAFHLVYTLSSLVLGDGYALKCETI